VRLARPVGKDPDADGSPRGWIELPTNQPAVNGLQFLMILQHPARRPLELALDTNANALLLFGGLRLRYATNTEAGSSGSPVFDKYWKLVGLHHYGDPAYNHPPAYNQAVPIGLIRTDLERTPAALAALGPAADSLRRVQVLSAAATAVRAELATGEPTDERIATAAARASATAYTGPALTRLSDSSREVIEREIKRAEEAWDEGMKSPSAGDKKKATDQFIYDLCGLLKIARLRNGGTLPPDWQQMWDDHGCS
jgi:hypothetical protein